MGTIADLLNTGTQTKKEPLSFLNESPSAIGITKPKVKKENYNRFIILPDSKIEIISAGGGG